MVKRRASLSNLSRLWRCVFWIFPHSAGLCGNFNNIQADDFTTAGGLREGTAIDFGNTWKTRANCPDIQRSFENPCSLSTENGAQFHPNAWKSRIAYYKCTACYVQKTYRKWLKVNAGVAFTEKYAQYWCSLLSDPAGVFARCHSEISPDTYKKVN